MVSSVNNDRIINNQANMKLPKNNFGVLQVPNSHPSVIIFSPSKAERDFNAMSQDIYEQKEKYNFVNRKSTPTSVWCLLGGMGMFALYKIGKMVIKK